MSISSSNKPPISTSSDPLFSTLLSFSALILLNFPRHLWRILFSPAILLTGFLLLSLLRLGATQKSTLRQNRNNRSQTADEIKFQQSESSAAVSEAVSGGSDGGDSCACFIEESFVQWNVRAPLEVIYEEYDKETSNESDDSEPRLMRVGLERYPSLSMYYPETDSDCSSDGVWPESMEENVCFVWDEDEDRNELIEISLDKTNKKLWEFQLELEDNLIEIDISPARNADVFPDED